ncbi:MAG: hypothetical protein AABW79_02755 [Nanoarchaeota archaeon]
MVNLDIDVLDFNLKVLELMGFHVDSRLDQGGFGEVYRGSSGRSMRAYKLPAVPKANLSIKKRVEKFALNNAHLKREFEAYVRTFNVRGVPSSASIFEATVRPFDLPLYIIDRPFIVGTSLDRADNGKPKTLSHEEFQYVQEIIGNCHLSGICCLDIAARNIIVSSRHKPVLIDFGTAVFREESGINFEEDRDLDFRALRSLSYSRYSSV